MDAPFVGTPGPEVPAPGRAAPPGPRRLTWPPRPWTKAVAPAPTSATSTRATTRPRRVRGRRDMAAR